MFLSLFFLLWLFSWEALLLVFIGDEGDGDEDVRLLVELDTLLCFFFFFFFLFWVYLRCPLVISSPFFLVCLYPSFSGLPRFSASSPILSVLPYVRPFSGFYKAREGHKSQRRSCVHASRNEARSVRDRGPWSAGCVSCWSSLQDEEMMNSVRSKRHWFSPKTTIFNLALKLWHLTIGSLISLIKQFPAQLSPQTSNSFNFLPNWLLNL